jgi:hypothetical protein
VAGPLGSEVETREPFVPLRYPRDRVPPVTSVRSTLIASSVRALKEHGLFEQYVKLLPAPVHDIILGSLAGAWLDIEVATEHYRTLDALQLTASQQFAVAASVTNSVQRYLVGGVGNLPSRAGATPWDALRHAQRTWDRVFTGGDVSIDKVGPNEIIRSILGQPLCAIQYYRNTTRAMQQVGLTPWCRKCVVTQVDATDTTLVSRTYWV